MEYPDCCVSHQRSAEFHHLLVCQNPNKHKINNLGNIINSELLIFIGLKKKNGVLVSPKKTTFNNWVLINYYTKTVYKTFVLINIEN